MSCENTVKNISLYCCHIGRCLFSHIYPFWNCYIQTSKIDDIVSAAYIIIFITSISNTLRTSFARSGGNEFNILSFSYMAYNVWRVIDLSGRFIRLLFAIFNAVFIDEWITVIHNNFEIIVEAVSNNHQFVWIVQESHDLPFYSFSDGEKSMNNWEVPPLFAQSEKCNQFISCESLIIRSSTSTSSASYSLLTKSPYQSFISALLSTISLADNK